MCAEFRRLSRRKGAIEADEEDSSVAIAAILALGAISLIFFPLVGHALHMSDHAYGLWTGVGGR